MTTVRSRSLADRLGTATSASADLEALARAIFHTIAADVPFTFACLATTDPASGLITRAFKSRALAIGDEDFAASEYGEPDINQFSEVAKRPIPVGVLSIDTGGRPDRCRRFRDFMAPTFGFTDELRLVCRARNATWGALALYRGVDEPPFTRRDAQLLAGVHELLADSVQRTLFTGDSSSRPATGGAAVLIVDSGDQVTDMTAAALTHIDDLGGWDNGSLPTNVLAVAALARAGTQSAQTRVRGRSGRWLALRAMSLDGPGTGRSVVVTIDAADPAAIGQLTLAARGLTAREQDVAQLVLQGASTRAIAAALFLSPHTVQDHLKAIFRKLEVTSRREMISQLALAEVDGPRPTAP